MPQDYWHKNSYAFSGNHIWMLGWGAAIRKTYNVYNRKAFNTIWSSLADYVKGLNVWVRSDQQLTEASEPLDGLRRREDG